MDRIGLIDLLTKSHQAFHMVAPFLRTTGQVKESLIAEILSAYMEAMSAAMERHLDETLINQLVPFVLSIAEASGDEDLETTGTQLKRQCDEFVQIIQELSNGIAEDSPMEINIEKDIIH